MSGLLHLGLSLPTIRWVSWVDYGRLWEDFGHKLDRALREQRTK